MAAALRPVTVARARALIARALLPDDVPRALGEIVLAPHQVQAATRLTQLLASHGGALLADEVGLGKTFCALAVASRYRRVLVLHPAALRDMWTDALARAGVRAALASYESLSRGEDRGREWDLVILDEAHHARSPGARRYAPIARACSRGDTLLLSATPLPNRRAELQALFALFMGERARQLDEPALRRLVVRRRHEAVASARLPPADAPRWIEVEHDATTLELLQQLPPPLAPADGGEAGVLLTWSLVRRWASTRAALRATLRRQLARAIAMQETLDAGYMPTSGEIARWTFGDDSLQAALPGLGATPPTLAIPLEDAARTVAAHASGVRRLLRHLRDTPDADDLRAEALERLRAAHPGEKILAFSEFAASVHAYWQRLRHHAGVGRLTAAGGEIASGTLSREQVLHHFAPQGQRRPPPRERETIDLLVTTDLLAEGVDLRDATVIVHLDLPWSPARLEQRVGRARRLGSTARRIAVYAMRPPASAEALLTVERRLRAKAEAAHLAVGTGCAGLPESDPALHADGDRRSDPEGYSAILERIVAWRRDVDGDADETESPGVCRVAVAEAATVGCLALVRVAGEPRLVAGCVGHLSDTAKKVSPAVELLERATDGRNDAARARRWHDAVAAWAAERSGEATVGPLSARPSGVADRLLARAAEAYAAIPAERRATRAAQVERVRALATSRLPAGVGVELATLSSDRSLGAEAWLDAVQALAARLRRSAAGAAGAPRMPSPEEDGVHVLILFIPPEAAVTTPVGPALTAPSSRASATPS